MLSFRISRDGYYQVITTETAKIAEVHHVMIHQDYTWVKPDGLAQLAARQIVALEVVRSKLTSVTNIGHFVVYNS